MARLDFPEVELLRAVAMMEPVVAELEVGLAIREPAVDWASLDSEEERVGVSGKLEGQLGLDSSCLVAEWG